MPDLYLQALMTGQIQKSSEGVTSSKKTKNKFEVEAEKQIEAYIQTLSFDEGNPFQNQFLTSAMQRARIKEELKEQAKLSELSSFITTSFKILITEGKTYLESKHWESMYEDLVQADDALNKTELPSLSTKNFKMLLRFTDSTITSIFTIAVAKFDETQYSNSLALFILLATLVPENSDFWSRSGMLAHECQYYEMAIRFFTAAQALDDSLLIPCLFSIDCYLKLNMQQEAEAAYAKAIAISATSPIDPFLQETLDQLHLILKKS